MRSRFVLVSAATLLSVVLVSPAMAQTGRPTFEVGGQTTLLRLDDSGTTNAGIGGRFTMDLTRWLALDAEVDFFPRDTFEVDPNVPNAALVSYHRRRTDVLAGVKIGQRFDRFGVFGKVRPGLTRLTDRGINCDGDMCALMLFARPEYRTEFALDLGGVVEIYPTSRLVARFDFGDVMIRNRGTAVPPCGDCTSHNFTTRFGVGLRF